MRRMSSASQKRWRGAYAYVPATYSPLCLQYAVQPHGLVFPRPAERVNNTRRRIVPPVAALFLRAKGSCGGTDAGSAIASERCCYKKLKSNLFLPLLRLKERMWDLEKPLKIVNRPLWEEMRNSSEKEVRKDNPVYFVSDCT